MKSALVVAILAFLMGCTTTGERASSLELPTNPLRKARVGDACRYKAVRDGEPGEPVIETWVFRVGGQAKGRARVDVSVLGPVRKPASPSPREPAYSVALPTADQGFSALELIRLFHRPELTSEGMFVVLERDVASVDGEKKSFPGDVLEHARQLRELTVTFRDLSLVRGTYRIVVADDLPVLGIAEAELDEEWTVVAPDGSLKTERRHEKLELVEAHEVTAK
jgi:hypothetical protein